MHPMEVLNLFFRKKKKEKKKTETYGLGRFCLTGQQSALSIERDSKKGEFLVLNPCEV